MSRDLIDRQEIIDRLDRVIEKGLVNILSGEHPITAEVMKEVIMALPSAEPDLQPTCNQLAKDTNIPCKDAISRQNAIDMIMGQPPETHYPSWYAEQIKALPSAQSDRDIPRKPIEGCSLSGRKKVKEATCRNCNFFLSHYRFYGEGKRITYCEHCGQAIDWEGWEWDD